MYLHIEGYLDKELENAEYFDVTSNEKVTSFGPICEINLFVGSNNSGKSRAVRSLLGIDHIEVSKNQFLVRKELEKLKEILENYLKKLNGIVSLNFKRDVYNDFAKQVSEELEDIFDRLIKDGVIANPEFSENILVDIIKKIDDCLRLPRANYNSFKSSIAKETLEIKYLHDFFYESKFEEYDEYYLKKTDKKSLKILKEVHAYLDSFFINEIEYIQKKSIYIPILRSSQSIYNERGRTTFDMFRHTVSINYEVKNENIFTGLDLYKKIKIGKGEKLKIRKRIKEFESFLSTNFFDSKPIEIVAQHAETAENEFVLITIGNEERKIHELGDGIQSLIILLYPIFMAEPETWFFIEEPEINLHPGMQRVFLEQLTKNEYLKSKNLKYFITSHSNHLLDLSLESNGSVSIFTFDKKTLEDGKSRFEIKNVKSGDTDILKLLGVKNSSVFMSNCTLWVEGITDREYIKTFLKAFQSAHSKKSTFKEDLHYSFFEYAGSNIMHYIFEEPEKIRNEPKIKAQLLSNKIFLISDKDLNKTKKHLHFEGEENKNFHYEVLGVKEIENIFSEAQLKKILPVLFETITEEDIDEADIQFNGYQDSFIGEYLESLFSEKIKPSYLTDSKALSSYYKNKLAEIISQDNFIVWDEMSGTAKKLIENIYTFISEANQ